MFCNTCCKNEWKQLKISFIFQSMDQQLNQPYYLKKLRDEFEARTARRPDYSLRAYANFLEVEAPSLSGVLKGARRLAKSKVAKVADKLNLSPEEKDLFIKSNRSDSEVTKQPSAVVNRYQLDSETHFRIIAEWEHYAILSLIETVDFKPQSKWIASVGFCDISRKNSIWQGYMVDCGWLLLSLPPPAFGILNSAQCCLANLCLP